MWKARMLQIRPRWWLSVCAAVALVVTAAVATPLLAQNATYSKYSLSDGLFGLTLDPSGRVWATTHANKLFRLDPGSNQLTTYSHAVAFQSSWEAAADSGGNIWFTNQVESGCRISKFDPVTRDIISWTWDTSDCEQHAVGVDSANNVWFGRPNAVSRLAPGTNTITTWAVPGTPTALDIDSQDRVWLLEYGLNRVAMLDPATNQLSEWSGPGNALSDTPRTISLDTQDRAWFAAQGVYVDPETVDVIVRLNAATNQMTMWVCPPGLCTTPGSVVADSSGMVWFAETGDYCVQRLDPSANPPLFTRWNVYPYSPVFAWQVVSDGSGGVWFIYHYFEFLHRLEPF